MQHKWLNGLKINALSAYSVLLALGLGGAYWASLPAASEGDEEKVSVFAIEPKSVVEVSYKGKDIDAKAAKREDGRYWVTHSKTEALPPPKDVAKDATKDGAKKDAKDAAKDSTKDSKSKDSKQDKTAPPTTKTTTEHFLANEKLDDLLKGLNPLYASRVIANADDKQIEEFGLKDKGEVFTIKEAGGKTFTLILGKRSYGSSSRFAREGEGKQRVFLVDDSGFENLERAPLRIYDRRLMSFELAEVQKAELQANGRTHRFSHTQRDKRGELIWTDEEENAPAKPVYDSWMDKISKLRLTAYATQEEEAKLKDAKPVLDLIFEKDGKPLDHLSIVKLAGDKPSYWISTDFLGVGVHAQLLSGRVEPMEKDLGQVLGETKS